MTQMKNDRLLHDLIVASTAANTSITKALADIGDSLEGIGEVTVCSKEFMQEIRTERRAFYNYVVKFFLALQVLELALIVILLSKIDPSQAGGIIGTLAQLFRFL